jgi:hypothetical protein
MESDLCSREFCGPESVSVIGSIHCGACKSARFPLADYPPEIPLDCLADLTGFTDLKLVNIDHVRRLLYRMNEKRPMAQHAPPSD